MYMLMPHACTVVLHSFSFFKYLLSFRFIFDRTVAAIPKAV